MRIPSIKVENKRNIRLAQCDSVPAVMIVTGPNGCGKTTLLHNLRRAAGAPGPILYLGPHRTSCRQQVRMRHLSQSRLSMHQLYSSPGLPGIEGIRVRASTRDAWDIDEASSYLKFGLCQIELDRQTALAERFDRDGEIRAGSVSDVWKPLRELTENLLPHLHFHQIDVSNRDEVRCLWRVHAKDLIVDIDELSSGEKSIIQLFFPLVEHRIYASLDEVKGAEPTVRDESVCVLIDEPELHLHPALQGKILDYIRTVSIAEKIQFILATHSMVIVEQATSDELYLLRPSELTPADDNQLVRIATDEDKLRMLRDVFGSTANLTAMRPIIVVEGHGADSSSRSASDARVFAFLSDRFSQVTLLPSGGRSQCITLADSLNKFLGTYSPDLNAFALVDSDLDPSVLTSPHIILLPVSMIENFLIDPEVIWNVITTVSHKTNLESIQDVQQALSTVLEEMTEHECSRRVKAEIGPMTFRLKDPIDEAEAQVNAHLDDVRSRVNTSTITQHLTSAQSHVRQLKNENLRRERFDGKKILTTFFKRHLHSTGMSREIFTYELARQASFRQSVQTFVQKLFESIEPPVEESS